MEGVKTTAAQSKVGIHPIQDLDHTDEYLRIVYEDERRPELQGAKAGSLAEPRDIAGGKRIHIGDWAQREMKKRLGGIFPHNFSAVTRCKMRALG